MRTIKEQIEMNNKRYSAYCSAHGMSQRKMHEHDNGLAYNFLNWIKKQKRSYKKVNSKAFIGDLLQDQDGFTVYLLKKYN